VKKKFVIILFYLCIISSFLSFSCIALDTGFITTEINEDSKKEYWDSISPVLSKIDPEHNHSIVCFDVNKNGDVAIGFDNLSVAVFDKDGNYQYKITFSAMGSYYVTWNENNIVLLFIRGYFAIEIDNNGNLVDMYNIINCTKNNDIWRDLDNLTTKVSGDNKYEMKNDKSYLDIFTVQTHSKLVQVNEIGNEKVFYESTFAKKDEFNIISLIIMIFGPIIIYFKFKKPVARNKAKPNIKI